MITNNRGGARPDDLLFSKAHTTCHNLAQKNKMSVLNRNTFEHKTIPADVVVAQDINVTGSSIDLPPLREMDENLLALFPSILVLDLESRVEDCFHPTTGTLSPSASVTLTRKNASSVYQRALIEAAQNYIIKGHSVTLSYNATDKLMQLRINNDANLKAGLCSNH